MPNRCRPGNMGSIKQESSESIPENCLAEPWARFVMPTIVQDESANRAKSQLMPVSLRFLPFITRSGRTHPPICATLPRSTKSWETMDSMTWNNVGSNVHQPAASFSKPVSAKISTGPEQSRRAQEMYTKYQISSENMTTHSLIR